MVKLKGMMEVEYQKVIDDSKYSATLMYVLDLKQISQVPELVADHRILNKFRTIRNALIVSTIKKQCRLSKETVFSLPTLMKQNYVKAKEKQISDSYEEFVTQKLRNDTIPHLIVRQSSSS